jgi:hypothetical protein
MEEDLLKATNLKKPVIMEVYELLKKKKLLKKSGLPKNLEELERLLQ